MEEQLPINDLLENISTLDMLQAQNHCMNETGLLACYYSMIFIDMTLKTSLSLNLILILVGLVTNILVVIVFCRSELRRLSISVHTIALAVSDMSLLCFPVFLKWLNETRVDLGLFHTEFWCKTHGYFDVSFCCWSAWNVVALSHERWIATCHPFVVYAKSTKSRSVTVSILIPIVTMIAFVWYPFLIERTTVIYENITENDTVYLIEEPTCRPKDSNLMLVFGVFTILATYVVPFLFISFFNCRIIKTLNEKIAKRKEYFGKGIFLNERRDQAADANGNSRAGSYVMTNNINGSSNNLNNNTTNNNNNTNNNNSRRNSNRRSRRWSRKSTHLTDCSDDQSQRFCVGGRTRGSDTPRQSQSSRRNSQQREIARCLDGHTRRSVSAKTEVLRTREQMNHLQRMKIDRAINLMLITVSISFLVLTFPYQIIWVIDQISEFIFKRKMDSNLRDKEKIKEDYIFYELISYSVKDIALVLRNLNFSINFFLYSTMSNLFRQELNCIFQNLGLYRFKLFKNELSTSTINSDYAIHRDSRASRIFSLFSNRSNADKNTIASRV